MFPNFTTCGCNFKPFEKKVLMIVQFGGMSTTWMWVSITGWLVRRSAPLCFSQSWRSVRAINHPGNPSYGGYVDQWFRTWVFQSTPTENRLMDLPLWKSHSNHMEISSYGDLIYIYTWCMYIYMWCISWEFIGYMFLVHVQHLNRSFLFISGLWNGQGFTNP
jgi:hypothetical protein